MAEVPVPDTDMEKNEGSSGESSIECMSCNHTHDIEINNRGGVVLVYVDGNSLDEKNVSQLCFEPEDYISPDELEWYDDIEWAEFVKEGDFYTYFSLSLEGIRAMLEMDVGDKRQAEFLNRMLLVQIISSMEAYLSDTFIYHVMSDSYNLRKLYVYDKNLNKEKHTMLSV